MSFTESFSKSQRAQEITELNSSPGENLQDQIKFLYADINKWEKESNATVTDFESGRDAGRGRPIFGDVEERTLREFMHYKESGEIVTPLFSTFGDYEERTKKLFDYMISNDISMKDLQTKANTYAKKNHDLYKKESSVSNHGVAEFAGSMVGTYDSNWNVGIDVMPIGYGAKAGYTGVKSMAQAFGYAALEGTASGGIAELIDQSAKLAYMERLQLDFSYAQAWSDARYNIAGSAVLGGVLGAGGHYIGGKFGDVRDESQALFDKKLDAAGEFMDDALAPKPTKEIQPEVSQPKQDWEDLSNKNQPTQTTQTSQQGTPKPLTKVEEEVLEKANMRANAEAELEYVRMEFDEEIQILDDYDNANTAGKKKILDDYGADNKKELTNNLLGDTDYNKLKRAATDNRGPERIEAEDKILADIDKRFKTEKAPNSPIANFSDMMIGNGKPKKVNDAKAQNAVEYGIDPVMYPELFTKPGTKDVTNKTFYDVIDQELDKLFNMPVRAKQNELKDQIKKLDKKSETHAQDVADLQTKINDLDNQVIDMENIKGKNIEHIIDNLSTGAVPKENIKVISDMMNDIRQVRKLEEAKDVPDVDIDAVNKSQKDLKDKHSGYFSDYKNWKKAQAHAAVLEKNAKDVIEKELAHQASVDAGKYFEELEKSITIGKKELKSDVDQTLKNAVDQNLNDSIDSLDVVIKDTDEVLDAINELFEELGELGC